MEGFSDPRGYFISDPRTQGLRAELLVTRLGQGERAAEVADLTHGVRQLDGRHLQGDGHWIYPGWVLPADAHDRLGEHELPTVAEYLASRSGTSMDAGVISQAKMSHAAQCDREPGKDSVPNTSADIPPTSVPATSTSPSAPADPPSTTAPVTAGDGGELTAVSVALVGSGLLAAGVIATLTRLRRVQYRHRRPGRRIPMPSGPLAEAERALRAGMDPAGAQFLDAALRAMATGVRGAGQPVPEVLGVLLSHTSVELLLAAPTAPAPAPFTASEDGYRWGLNREVDLARFVDEDALAPLPGLVTLGDTYDGERFLVNLEALGLTALAGPPADTQAVLDAIAVELANSLWGGDFELVLVGFGPTELERLERVHRIETLDELLPALERKAEEIAALLDGYDYGSVVDARGVGEAGDNWTLTIVLSAEAPSAETLERLDAVTAHPWRTALAVVVADDLYTTRGRLELAGDVLRVDALGFEVRPQRLSAQEAGAVGSLLAVATRLDDVAATDPPYDRLPRWDEPAGPRACSPSYAGEDRTSAPLPVLDLALSGLAGPDEELLAEPEVEVRVLGPIEIVGASRIEHRRAFELVVCLAMHPNGLDADRLWAQLRPDDPLVAKTLYTRAGEARQALGVAPDGSPRLPRTPKDGVYRLHPSVDLDWARFQRLVEEGQRRGARGMGLVRRALELVRGQPFEAAPPGFFGWTQDFEAEMRARITDAAVDLGEHCLKIGDHDGAAWAARRGFVLDDLDERLARVLMRVANAKGNRAGVQAVYDDLRRRLEDDLGTDGPHPETVALFEELMGRRRPRPVRS